MNAFKDVQASAELKLSQKTKTNFYYFNSFINKQLVLSTFVLKLKFPQQMLIPIN